MRKLPLMNHDADVCLILEGTYPYVSGGVAGWAHELIERQSHLKFHILSITPPDADLEMKYEFPKNVVGHSIVSLQGLPSGLQRSTRYSNEIVKDLEAPLTALTQDGKLKDLESLLEILNREPELGSSLLLDSKDSWELLRNMYEAEFSESSFLDYFWSWRALMGNLYSLMLAPLPRAKSYHTLCTGYAGLLAARAKIETGKPVMLTEHGIYTNERRIEVAAASWLDETAAKALTVDHIRRDLRDLWSDAFATYSKIIYEAADEIITLYEGNRETQIADGANPSKIRLIANGVDVARFGNINRESHERPTIGLIGRVVPIKDIKSFIRVIEQLKAKMPDVEAFIIGSTDEDPDYYEECKAMISHLGLEDAITFTGKVNVDEYLKRIDVLVLTSISEAQPLVVLEAGACGIPTVATNVGSCSELIKGAANENPSLGPGGAVLPLSNPSAMADSIHNLINDRDFYTKCSTAIRERVHRFYNKDDQHKAYKSLYEQLTAAA